MKIYFGRDTGGNEFVVGGNATRRRSALASWASARLPYLMTALVIILLGLVLRLVPLGLPYLVVKYGGSALWGAMVYSLVRACAPSAGLGSASFLAFAISVVTELSRLYHTPELDAFRLTLAGTLLLGRVFSVWNIAAYCAGIALATLVETRLKRAGVQTSAEARSPSQA
jgi:hypothetical protein